MDLAEIKADLEIFKSLKGNIFPKRVPKRWKREGFTLMAGDRSGDTILAEFGKYEARGHEENAALDFAIAAHNLPLDHYLDALIKRVEELEGNAKPVEAKKR